MVKLAKTWSIDPIQIYRLSIHLSYAIHIDMDAKLSHQHGSHAGFHCVSIDTDSVSQLRRLVELNLGDSTLLERDLQALLSGVDSGR
jgi:hypothetical protein